MIDFRGKKVMFIATTDNMIWQFLIPHINDLTAKGARVDCFCNKTGFWFDELKNKFKLNMIEMPFCRSPFRMNNLKGYKKLKNYQKLNNYDLVYCQQPVGGMLGRLIGKKFKIPVIYVVHGFFFFKGNCFSKNLTFKTAEKFLSRYTDVLITMTKEDFFAIKDWKVKYKYYIHGIGFDNSKYNQSSFDKSDLRQKINLSENDKVVVTVAEFIKRKNYPTMLKCFAKLHKMLPNTKYLICGTGKYFKKTKNYAKKLGLENCVTFLGYQKDINKILQISDTMLLLSKQEGLTMSIMEAMYYGLPVVTSDVRGNRDLIDDNKGGRVVDIKNIDMQAQALYSILTNKSLQIEMGEYNKNKVKDYEINIVKKELNQIYNQVEL